jgi:hypothetical protein
MNPRLARFLIRLYPPAWRKRFGAEFKALLESERSDLRTAFDVGWSAMQERIQPQHSLTRAQDFPTVPFHAWCERAPWAIFSLAPMLMLAGAYVIACLILWVGWRVFLPGYDSPFGAGSHGVANLYFQADKSYYFAAPVLVGWWLEIVAVRHRVKAVWLAMGLLLVAWMGAAARIQASHATVHRGLGHISMDFDFWFLLQNARDGMLHVVTILLLAAFPYLLWRLQRARSSVSG